MRSSLLILPLLLFLSGCSSLGGLSGNQKSPSWAKPLEKELAILGFNNWIVIAEASFPVLAGPGVRTLPARASISEVLDEVLTQLEYSDSVTPRITLPKELRGLHNDQAPGVDSYRQELQTALHGFPTRELDYRALTRLLTNTSKKYRVLVIKTETSLPYTSVFLELDTNYWDHENEQNLRRHLLPEGPSQ